MAWFTSEVCGGGGRMASDECRLESGRSVSSEMVGAGSATVGGVVLSCAISVVDSVRVGAML
jgi:hypothetical protein